MRKIRRRVGRASVLPRPAAPARAVSSASAIVHSDGNRLCLAAQLDGLHQRRASRLIIIFDLAIEALKALGGLDFPRRLDRPHRTGAFAQTTGTAAFGTTLEQIEKVQPIESCEQAAQGTEEEAIDALQGQPNGQKGTGPDHIRPG